MSRTNAGKAIRNALAAAVMLAGMTAAVWTTWTPLSQGQETRPPRARNLVQTGSDLFKQGDYEGAAKAYEDAHKARKELSPRERNDLDALIKQNHAALKKRQDGQEQLRKAEAALREGRRQAAASLLRGLATNQYLSRADRQTLETLQEGVRSAAGGKTPPPPSTQAPGAQVSAQLPSAQAPSGAGPTALKGDYKSLLAAARESLKQSDLDAADAFAREADKVGSNVPGWMQPWNDNPAKVRRDVMTARAKQRSKDNPLQTTQRISDDLGPPMTAPALKQTPAKAPATAAPSAAPPSSAPLTGAPPATMPTGSPAEPSGSPKIDPRTLVRQGRILYQQNKLDEAEKLCHQAATSRGVRWGLFEDSPDKLRSDISDARKRRDKAEAAALVKEARAHFQKGDLLEAKSKAWKAQQLHGPYNLWDLGDRPDRLLSEIQRIEAKQGLGPQGMAPAPPSLAKNEPRQPGPGPGPVPGPSAQLSWPPTLPSPEQIAQTGGAGLPTLPPVPAANAPTAGARARAHALLAEARVLEKRGLLIESRNKALEARMSSAGVAYRPDEDSPETLLVSLNAQCDQQIHKLVQRASDVAGMGSDPMRFRKAEVDLTQARRLAMAFGQDPGRIDQKLMWLRNVQVSAGLTPPPLPDVFKQEAPRAVDAGQRQRGLELLDKARLELKAGNTRVARRLAEEAFNPALGAQAEAAQVLRSIDAEEHNQGILAAHRSAEAAIEAYKQRNYKMVQGILSSLDVRQLSPAMQRTVREIAAAPEMQAGMALTPPQPGHLLPVVGSDRAVTSDRPRDGFDQFKAMEEIQVQKLRFRSLEVQRAAMDHSKVGKHDQGIDLLKEHLHELSLQQLSPEIIAILKRPVEGRIQQLTMLKAQWELQNSQEKLLTHSEGKRNMTILKNQEEVAELIKQYRMFHKEGKLKEALAAARKAKELDPDNVAADAAIQIVTVEERQRTLDKLKGSNEHMFWEQLNHSHMPSLHIENPLELDRSRLEVARGRKDVGPYGYNRLNSVERAIEQKLSMPVSLHFKDTKLSDAIEYLHQVSNLNIVPDRAALQEASVSLEQPLTLTIENVSLKSALNIMLRQVRLTYVIRNEVIEITTEERAKGNLKMVTYPVADLVVPVESQGVNPAHDLTGILNRVHGAGGPNTNLPTAPAGLPNGQTVSAGSTSSQGPVAGGSGASLPNSGFRQPPRTIEDQLINLIENTVAPSTWKAVGGQGSVQYYSLGMALVINQTQEVQEEVLALLTSLRRLLDLEIAIEMKVVTVSEAFFERIGLDFDVNILTRNSRFEQQLLTSNFAPFGQINQFRPNNFVSGLTPAGVFTPDLNIPIRSNSFEFTAPPFGGFPNTIGTGNGGLALGLAFLSDIQVFMFLEAAQGDRRTNVMQAPKLTVFNGQTATMFVGDQTFFILNFTQLPTQTGLISFVPNNVPVPLGVGMAVTPVVSADRRFVRLNLTPDITAMPNFSANVPLIPVQFALLSNFFQGPGFVAGPPETILQVFLQQPTFTTVTMTTTVNVPDGGTVLLGGLKTLAESRNEFGPPILSKIPYISRLFRNIGYGREVQSLMIMVTPRIIINEEEEQIFLGQVPPIPRP